MSIECDVCEGSGRALIFDRYGNERYSIRCPECGGCGSIVDEVEEPNDWPPASTAARIKSMDELRSFIAQQKSE